MSITIATTTSAALDRITFLLLVPGAPVVVGIRN